MWAFMPRYIFSLLARMHFRIALVTFITKGNFA